MRIAYVSADRGISPTGGNGAATHLREFANAMVARGAEVKILTPLPSGGREVHCELIDIDTDEFLPVLRRMTAKLARASDTTSAQASEIHGLLLNQSTIEHLDRLHARWPIDLVYERYSLWSYAGLEFAGRRQIPFFLEVNAPLAAQQEEYRRLYNAATARALESVLLGRADRVIVPSKVLVEYVVEQGARAGRVRIIPCGVAREFFTSGASAKKAPGAGEFVVGFLGSLKPWHGLDVLLEAFKRLLSRTAGYRLLVVGDGPLRTVIEDFRQACPRPDCVTITGEVAHRDVPRYLAQMDVGVASYPPLPTFYFSPLKIFEYAAAGVPIVASASGQIGELLVHRSSALLHPPGSVTKIAKHIEQLRANPELAARLARRARSLTKAYTWDRLAARLLAIAETARRRYTDAAQE